MTYKDKYVDLHIHSSISDGTWNPHTIVEIAKKHGVGLLSITDHDDISGAVIGETLAKENNLKYLRGVEISSTYNGDWYHILGYGIDIENENLLKLLEENSYKLEHKDDNTIKYLINEGYNIDFEEYLNYENDKKRGGWKSLNYLIDKGICSDVNDYFNELFKDKQAVQFPKYREPHEVVKLIKEAGGVPILAHPYYSRDITEEVHVRLKRLMEFGVEGFECFHPNHGKSISKQCAEWCDKNGLIMTVGSDSHGDFIKTRIIGKPSIKAREIYLGKLEEYL